MLFHIPYLTGQFLELFKTEEKNSNIEIQVSMLLMALFPFNCKSFFVRNDFANNDSM